MVEDSAPTSIQARIAALNLGQVGRTPNTPPPSYEHATGRTQNGIAPPSLPAKRPTTYTRQQTTNVPPLNDHTSAASNDIGNQPDGGVASRHTTTSSQHSTRPSDPNRPVMPPRPHKAAPALPPRRPSEQPTPQLPPRRPSETPSSTSQQRRPDSNLTRRSSIASTSSAVSSVSAISAKTGASSRTTASSKYEIRAPAYDPGSLPPLPPKRNKAELDVPRVPLKASYSSPAVPARTELGSNQAVGSGKAQPPQLPARQPSAQDVDSVKAEVPRRSALSFGLNSSTEAAPSLPSNRPEAQALARDSPPPIPTASRPDLSALLASKPKPTSTTAPTSTTPTPEAMSSKSTCLHCRDFSAPDAQAARFPLSSLPSRDARWLSHQLCTPFPSATDKARVLFTWLHHNISYNASAFFSNNLPPSTPASTLSTGLAVCEGYAALFTALATYAGLSSLVVGGHGKGYGYAPPAPGAALPPFTAGHAWNAVRIDGGVWKLIDCCWGAGTVNGPAEGYVRRFNPAMFTVSNEEFGERHYPSNAAHFFRGDGRRLGWEEYLLGSEGGEGPRHFGGFTAEEGFSEVTFKPRARTLRIGDGDPSLAPWVRFQFATVCEHWDPVRNGRGPYFVYILIFGEGGGERKVPFRTNGRVWWVDVRPAELGVPGGKVRVAAVNGFEGRNGRGVTGEEFERKLGRVGMGFGFVAEWDLVA